MREERNTLSGDGECDKIFLHGRLMSDYTWRYLVYALSPATAIAHNAEERRSVEDSDWLNLLHCHRMLVEENI